MRRIDKVRKALEALGDDKWVTAGDLSKELGLSRANVSSDLNRLFVDGLVKKQGGRPVYYSLAYSSVEPNEHINVSEFDAFLHANPSMFRCGEQAKAAVLYPPKGMHMLLLGETGVGKSMLAELIFKFALGEGRVKEKRFVAFNCADYANNPQLLLSQLFGVNKGAYTGANVDKPGLMEQADGGILFLDEIHRLPPEGQEMLFTYTDKGTFRRMGETTDERSADVIIICATTEDPQSALLSTFIRRIPMVIPIPSLEERTPDERLNLITRFLKNEAQTLGVPVQVSVNSMRGLLGYHCPGNIGQLKTDIQILCAKAYSEFLSGKRESISITSYSLPEHIRSMFFSEQSRKEVWNRLSSVTTRFIEFESGDKSSPLPLEAPEFDIYSILEKRMEDMRRVGIKEEQINDEVGILLQRYYSDLQSRTNVLTDYSSLERYVGPEVSATVDKMLAYASQKLQRSIGDGIRYGLTLHVFNALSRVRKGQSIVNPRLEAIHAESPEIYSIAKECMDIASQDFGLLFPEDEAGFITLFLASSEQPMDHRDHVEVILVMHGESTATSMANTANRLTGADVVRGFDMQLDEHPRAVYQRILDYLRRRVGLREVFLLADMGSLSNFAYSIEGELGVRCKQFTLASTLHVMEAARKANLGYSLHDVYSATKKVNELAEISNRNEDVDAEKKLYILSVCTTGEGSAMVINERLNSRLDLKDGLCEVIPLQMTDKPDFLKRVGSLEETGRIIAIVSTFDTGLKVQHYGITQIFDRAGIETLQDIINTETSYAQVSHALIPMLASLDGALVAGDIRSTIESIASTLGHKLNGEMLIGCFCHIGCMLDRLKRGEPTSRFPKKQQLMDKYPNEIAQIQKHCNTLGQEYEVEIPDDEICYLTAFFTRADIL